jgi:GT2 family glycosyltransferase
MSAISVLLPYKDARSTLLDAARSVLDDLGADDELVAIDDGSRDGGDAVITELAAADRRVIAVATGGVGISKALMLGLDRARGEYIARMDADDVSHRGRFAAERRLLEEDDALGAAGVRIALEGGEAGLARYVAWQNGLVTKEDHARAIYIESPLCHPSVMLRRRALEAVGGWHDPPWPEDWDLWLRLHRAGFGLAKVPEVFFTWRRAAGNLTTSDPRYAIERLLEARATYLAKELAGRSFGVWGAGQTGRRLARALEAHGLRAAFFIDIDPKKIGRTARGAPILAPDAALERVRTTNEMVVVAVGAPGARDLVREHVTARGLLEGRAFVCAA